TDACDPTTGNPTHTAVTDGTTCSDNNACTVGDSCQAGTCQAGAPKAIVDDNNACTTDACDPATGSSTHTPVNNGTSCDDGNACTSNDTCQAGACTGGTTKTCAASDQCHIAGTCNPANGQCSNPAAPNGTSCDDGQGCTVN